MIRHRWRFAVGMGLIGLGPCVAAGNVPAGDMIWEWPSFGVMILLAGVVVIASSIDDGTGGTNP